MKQSHLLLAGLGLILSSAGAVTADPLADVPAGHWAKPAVQSMLKKKILSAGPDGKFQGSKPVTRYELAVALDRMINYIEAGRKPLHPASPQTAMQAPAGASPETKAALTRLSRNGFLPVASPIFHGTGAEIVTAGQFSEALAQVTIRLSDRSLPPSKD